MDYNYFKPNIIFKFWIPITLLQSQPGRYGTLCYSLRRDIDKFIKDKINLIRYLVLKSMSRHLLLQFYTILFNWKVQTKLSYSNWKSKWANSITETLSNLCRTIFELFYWGDTSAVAREEIKATSYKWKTEKTLGK